MCGIGTQITKGRYERGFWHRYERSKDATMVLFRSQKNTSLAGTMPPSSDSPSFNAGGDGHGPTSASINRVRSTSLQIDRMSMLC